MARSIIFTDLDGTLIDFETYSIDETYELVRELHEVGVPVVFCSSKTFKEQQHLQSEYGIALPCIVENGSAIVAPRGFWRTPPEGAFEEEGWARLQLGLSSVEIRKRIARIESSVGESLCGFSSMATEDIASLTGLDLVSAKRAQERDYSETLAARKPDDFWDGLAPLFEAHGLKCLFGGRFRTVTSLACDKGRAIRRFLELIKKDRAEEFTSIGLGDSANDLALLNAVDSAFQVQRSDGTWAAIEAEGVSLVEGIGPKGWVKAVRSKVDTLRWRGLNGGKGEWTAGQANGSASLA